MTEGLSQSTQQNAAEQPQIQQEQKKHRRAVQGDEPAVLCDIYEDDANIAIWHRDLSDSLQRQVSDFIAAYPTFQTSMTVSPQSAHASVQEALKSAAYSELSASIAELVDMFCCLFELKRVGLRLTVLSQAMCPRFHVDKVPCRLVTTFQGIATEWLPHSHVDRSQLGAIGKIDSESGLYANAKDIQQLTAGDVALLKGELWEGNESAGLVHRSPAVNDGDMRLLLTLDFIN
nr:DUF1826 domain-containing protein [Thaumasiovibrio subtropicus]